MSRFGRMQQTRQEFFDNKDSNRKLAYERRVCRKLLHRMGVTALHLSGLRPENDEEAERFLTIGWLHATFQSLPIRLTTHVIWEPELHDFMHTGKRNNAVWRGWREVKDTLSGELSAGRAIGCVFPVKHCTGLGDMIMHTMAALPYSSRHTVFARMHFVEADEHITVETLDSFAYRLSDVCTLSV